MTYCIHIFIRTCTYYFLGTNFLSKTSWQHMQNIHLTNMNIKLKRREAGRGSMGRRAQGSMTSG